MSEATTLKGRCLCGAVTLEAQPKKLEVGACHCNICRRWTGGPFFALECEDGVTFENPAQIGVYRSSEWAERGFCKVCGTSLYWKVQGKDFYVLPVDLLDDPGPLTFTHEIFIEEKPTYYAFANETHQMTGEEVFAAFAEANGEN